MSTEFNKETPIILNPDLSQLEKSQGKQYENNNNYQCLRLNRQLI